MKASELSVEGADGFDQQVTEQPVAVLISQAVTQLTFAKAGLNGRPTNRQLNDQKMNRQQF